MVDDFPFLWTKYVTLAVVSAVKAQKKKSRMRNQAREEVELLLPYFFFLIHFLGCLPME